MTLTSVKNYKLELLWKTWKGYNNNNNNNNNNNSSKKKRTCHLESFVIPVHNSVKTKESKKIDKYLDLARELKKLKKMVKVIPIVVGALEMVSKGL